MAKKRKSDFLKRIKYMAKKTPTVEPPRVAQLN